MGIKVYYLSCLWKKREMQKVKYRRNVRYSSQEYLKSNIKMSHAARRPRTSRAIDLKEKLNKSVWKILTMRKARGYERRGRVTRNWKSERQGLWKVIRSPRTSEQRDDDT